MKYLGYFFLAVTAISLLSLAGLSIKSRFKTHQGLVNGKLAQCPEVHNCICTENETNQNFKPIRIDLHQAKSEWKYLSAAIVQAGGEVQQDDGDYLWATFVTPLFRFVDDFEARLDMAQACIHLRSASRVGDYDFGTNLKRMKRIIEIYQEKKKNKK